MYLFKLWTYVITSKNHFNLKMFIENIYLNCKRLFLLNFNSYLSWLWRWQSGSASLFMNKAVNDNKIRHTPFIYSQKWNCYFQNRIIMFCLPVPTLIYLWEIYIFPGSVCLFCCREICGPILGKYESLTDTCMWKLGLRPRIPRKGIHERDFPCSVTLQATFLIL